MMGGLPKSVRVGPHVIKFVELSKEDYGKNYGQFSPLDLQIELRDTYAAGSMAVETVLHEIVHAIWLSANLMGEVDEERIAKAIGSSLAQIFRDNTELIAWLQEMVKK